MKFLNKLQLLFFVIILLIGIITATLLLKPTSEYKKFDGGYCGNAMYQALLKSKHEAGEQLFKENCKSCHKIHEDAVGPALYGVADRRPRKWIYSFIQNSQKLINDNDTMAVNVFNKYHKAQMTAFPTLTSVEIDSLLIYIDEYPDVQPHSDIIVFD